MKPGKRSSGGGGGGRSSSFSDRRMNEFRNRLEASTELDHRSSVDEIVDHLRGGYPDYERLKRQVFRRFVTQTLASPSFKRSKPLPVMSGSSEEEEEEELAGSKRRKRARNEKEERLQQIEEAHIRKIRQSNGHVSSSSSAASEEEDEESTSEDAIYGEELEPKFDLMKSMLRESYTDPKSGGKSAAAEQKKEKNVEMDIPGREKVRLVAGSRGPRPETVSNKAESEAKSSVSRGVEVKRNEGPKFSDLGGMQKVLEELNKEVIRPLRRSWLPQWLGVRPMSGILLCGPPGCGKTTLAHAIANETGIPFYKISATEVVSGVSGMASVRFKFGICFDKGSCFS